MDLSFAQLPKFELPPDAVHNNTKTRIRNGGRLFVVESDSCGEWMSPTNPQYPQHPYRARTLEKTSGYRIKPQLLACLAHGNANQPPCKFLQPFSGNFSVLVATARHEVIDDNVARSHFGFFGIHSS